MARAFEKDKEDDDRETGKRGNVPMQEGAGAACNDGDEADSTEIVQAYHPDTIRADAEEGRHLLLDFVRTEMMRNGMNDEVQCLDDQVTAEETDMVDPERLMDWTRAGQELRQLADAFSRSKERQTVQKRAQALSMDALDYENFVQLLQELFQGGGVTRERILVLFFFCADVAIEALRRGFHRTFHQLLSWSLRYIATSVAQYVHSMGGWGVVLRQSLDIAYHVSACCAFVAVVAACLVYIKRNMN